MALFGKLYPLATGLLWALNPWVLNIILLKNIFFDKIYMVTYKSDLEQIINGNNVDLQP